MVRLSFQVPESLKGRLEEFHTAHSGIEGNFSLSVRHLLGLGLEAAKGGVVLGHGARQDTTPQPPPVMPRCHRDAILVPFVPDYVRSVAYSPRPEISGPLRHAPHQIFAAHPYRESDNAAFEASFFSTVNGYDLVSLALHVYAGRADSIFFEDLSVFGGSPLLPFLDMPNPAKAWVSMVGPALRMRAPVPGQSEAHMLVRVVEPDQVVAFAVDAVLLPSAS